MKGQASDISHICEFSWYQWVMFRDVPVQYPSDNRVLGSYLGPARDMVPAMNAKILKANGEVFPYLIGVPLHLKKQKILFILNSGVSSLKSAKLC